MGISTHHFKERRSLARHARRGRKAIRLQRSLRSLRRNHLSACCVLCVAREWWLGRPLDSGAEWIDDLQTFELKIADVARHHGHAVRKRRRGDHRVRDRRRNPFCDSIAHQAPPAICLVHVEAKDPSGKSRHHNLVYPSLQPTSAGNVFRRSSSFAQLSERYDGYEKVCRLSFCEPICQTRIGFPPASLRHDTRVQQVFHASSTSRPKSLTRSNSRISSSSSNGASARRR